MQDVMDVHNELIKEKPLPYKTIVIDSLSELQKLDLREVMEYLKAHSQNPENVDLDVASVKGWGKSGVRIARVVRAYRDLPCNTIMTCLVGTEQEDRDKPIKLFYPMLPGKLRSEIPGYFDIVGFLQSDADSNGDIKRTLQVAKTKRVVAKDRTSALGKVVDNPTIPMLWNMIHSDGQAQDTKE